MVSNLHPAIIYHNLGGGYQKGSKDGGPENIIVFFVSIIACHKLHPAGGQGKDDEVLF